MNKIRLKNLLFEAALAVDRGQTERVLLCLDQARLRLLEPKAPAPAPENDPARPAFDREAWRAAKGA